MRNIKKILAVALASSVVATLAAPMVALAGGRCGVNFRNPNVEQDWFEGYDNAKGSKNENECFRPFEAKAGDTIEILLTSSESNNTIENVEVTCSDGKIELLEGIACTENYVYDKYIYSGDYVQKLKLPQEAGMITLHIKYDCVKDTGDVTHRENDYFVRVNEVDTNVAKDMSGNRVPVHIYQAISTTNAPELKSIVNKLFGFDENNNPIPNFDQKQVYKELVKELVGKEINVTGTVAQRDISIDGAMPAGGLDVSFTVEGVKKGQSVMVLHYIKSEKRWEIIDAKAVADNVVTGHFNSLSPVLVVVGEESKADTSAADTSTATGNGAMVAPKTGEFDTGIVVAIMGMAMLSLAGVVMVTRKRAAHVETELSNIR